LKPNQRKRIQNLYGRRVKPWQLVSPELARALCELSTEIGRQLGVLIDRRGYVNWVIIGSDQRLYLPDIGRMRGGRAHFRGVRLVHTHLHNEPLSRDDLSDLSLLRLDHVVAVSPTPNGLAGRLQCAYLLPGDTSSEPWQIVDYTDPYAIGLDFLAFITDLEAEFSRKVSLPSAEFGEERAMLVVCAQRVAAGEDNLAELAELASTASVDVVGTVLQVRPKPDPKFVIGKGKLEEVVLETMQKGAELVIFGHDLSPAQARAIADFTEINVLDRTQLILDIFAKRAHTKDGKLQVELAQLKYRLPRLTAQDSGLSRLVGRIGGRGPGETKLEVDRRRSRDRITRLERHIDKLSRQRAVRRAQRHRNKLPVVALVGYTNAGKSTLLNKLTRSKVFVEDKLFATLDPTSRRLRFPRDRQVILTDTVGFIRDLPKDLVNAFRATLEELRHADLLLHVVDISDPRLNEKTDAVESILEDLDLARTPRLLLLNKCDRIDKKLSKTLARRFQGIELSALYRRGFDHLLQATEDLLWREGLSKKGTILSDSY
jgi:GTP-binding protein HflX